MEVGGENLLEARDTDRETEDGLGRREDVNLVLGVKLLGKVLDKGVVKVTATKVAVVGSRLDGKLALGEGDNGNRVARVTDVNKDDVAGLLGVLGKVGLGDTVAKGDSGGVVDEAEGVEASDLSGVKERAALDVGVPSGDSNDNVRNVLLELDGGSVTELGEVSTNQLGVRLLSLLAKVVDADTGLASNVDELGVDKLLLKLGNLGVRKRAADQTLERANSVLKVGGLSSLGGLANETLAGGERDERAVG